MEVGTKWPWHCGQTENNLEDLEVEIELDEIEKRAPTAPCRLKRCDWPNVERTQSRHEKLAASVIGKTRQDSFMLQTCRVLATLYTDPFLWEWSQRSAQPWRPNLPRLWTWWSWWSLDWWDNWQEINGNQWLFITTLITKYWLIQMVFQWYSNDLMTKYYQILPTYQYSNGWWIQVLQTSFCPRQLKKGVTMWMKSQAEAPRPSSQHSAIICHDLWLLIYHYIPSFWYVYICIYMYNIYI